MIAYHWCHKIRANIWNRTLYVRVRSNMMIRFVKIKFHSQVALYNHLKVSILSTYSGRISWYTSKSITSDLLWGWSTPSTTDASGKNRKKDLTIHLFIQKYRDDNKDPLKIYTNPDYFFELWRENLQKEMEKARQERKDKKRRAKEKEKELF